VRGESSARAEGLVSIIFDSVARRAFSEHVVKAHSHPAASLTEKRITLAPVYSPNRQDAHGEYTTSEALEDAIIEFSKSGNRRLMLQHGDLGDHHVGDILSVFTWPWPVTCDMTNPATLQKRKHTFEAGTAWAWVQWDQDAWQLVKTGKLTGYSMGGRAVRVPDSNGALLPHMGYARKSAPHLLDTETLREIRTLCEELLRREPKLAAAEGIGKSIEGVLVASEDWALGAGVYHLRNDGGVEFLREVEDIAVDDGA
jgi:hypothetical protein